MVESKKTRLRPRAAAALVWKWGWARPTTGLVVVAEEQLDRCRELEVVLVQAQLGSMQELAAA